MREFKSKILLFGEYGLMKGASALSMPFAGFKGKLSFDKSMSQWKESNRSLKAFGVYLLESNINGKLHFPLDLQKYQEETEEGLWFDSNIPKQYGVGSSGALVAALYDRYSPVTNEAHVFIDKLKADFAVLESYFHGTSSGLDPLVSYLDSPVLLKQSGGLKTVTVWQNQQIEMFLVDTKACGATEPLVNYFIRKVNQHWFLQKLVGHFIPVNDFCIEHFLSGDPELFFHELYKLVEFQLRHLKRMIPAKYRKMIRESLENRLFIKLLGSGGGGFLLGFASNKQTIDDFSKRYQLKVIRI
jgi:mevalonate kinase